MKNFWSGFEKEAIFGDPDIALGGWTEKGKDTSKAVAEAAGRVAGEAAEARKKNLIQYLLNPAVAGPFEELVQRATRRHYASAAESPHLTGWVPLAGLIRGGEAGEEELERKDKK